jgi:hypothetical protein
MLEEEIPNDSDGNALRGLAANGSDIFKEMEIDFIVDVPDHESGLSFGKVVESLGYKTRIEFDDESKRWTCYCSQTMVPLYGELLEIQKKFKELGRPFHAKPDGWGTFGNAT